VVGIGHAAYVSATMLARRFAVITTLLRGVPALEDGLAAHGVSDRCVGVLPLERGVREQGGAEAVERIVRVAREAVDQRGAEAVVLACGAMASSAAAISERVRMPVCDGVAFGAGMTLALWRSGLRTSKRGAYSWAEELSC
jgi:allantoin racemase